MNRLQIQISLMAGLAMMGATDVQPVAADSIRVPIRSANARVSQLDPNGLPAPAAALPPGSAPLPPPPVPDYDQPASPQRATAAPGGGAMYRGPLGADFQRPETPKKQYLGDGHLLTPQPIMNGPVPFNPNQPGMVTGPGIPHESEVTSGPVTGTDPYGIAPPPGTLGQTYHRRSRLIDDEKHPRVGIVEVHLSAP